MSIQIYNKNILNVLTPFPVSPIFVLWGNFKLVVQQLTINIAIICLGLWQFKQVKETVATAMSLFLHCTDYHG